MGVTKQVSLAAVAGVLAAVSASEVHAAPEPDLGLSERVRERAPEPERGRFPGAGVGVRVGMAHANLQSRRLPGLAEEVSDDVSDTMTLVVPTVHLGGEGFFFKVDVPVMRWDGGYTVGLGLYPLNYGHYFERSRLMPYISGGASLGVAMLKQDQDDRVKVPLRAAMFQARTALGLKWRPAGGVVLSLEAGFSPFAVGGVVDDQRRRAAEADAEAGRFPDLSRGNRPVSAGVGNVTDLALGLEWM